MNYHIYMTENRNFTVWTERGFLRFTSFRSSTRLSAMLFSIIICMFIICTQHNIQQYIILYRQYAYLSWWTKVPRGVVRRVHRWTHGMRTVVHNRFMLRARGELLNLLGLQNKMVHKKHKRNSNTP